MPLVLFFSHGGWPTAIAAFVMLCFHFGILSAIPMGVPLEWNVFMMFSVLALFVGHADVGLTRHDQPAAGACCSPSSPAPWCSETCSRARSRSCRACATTPATGTPRCGASSRRPTRRSSADIVVDRQHAAVAAGAVLRQPGDRRRCTSTWDMRSAPSTLTAGRCSPLCTARWPGSNEDDYVVTEGERICSTAIGWNFGDGHMHNEQLIAAMQERCHFEPGEVRVVLLDAQPIHRQTAGVPAGRRGDRRIRARLRASRRHGDAPAVGRHRAGARDVGEGQR